MDKAFDIVFQEEVDASSVAKKCHNVQGARFRYQCLYCGEEVYLAAADSRIKAPHFRHRRGNNDMECERYLGQQGAIEHYLSIRKNSIKHIGFCFNIEQKTFEIALKYSDEDLKTASEKGEVFSVYSKNYSDAFLTMPLNRNHIIPNVDNYCMLKEYANDYYVSYNEHCNKIKYSDVIKKDSKLNIFRASNFNRHYKKNISNVLYTSVRYLAVSEELTFLKKLEKLPTVDISIPIFSFRTMERQFYAAEFIINDIDFEMKLYFEDQELAIDYLEEMDILWPPVFMRDEISVSFSEKIYLFTSFELIPHGNVNSSSTTINQICDNVSELSFNNKVTIYEKNIECNISKEEKKNTAINFLEPECIHKNIYVVPETYHYFLFDKDGCTSLAAGEKIYLSSGDHIAGYKNGHIKVIVLPEKTDKQDKNSFMQDIIKYHPKTELFNPDDFMNIEVDDVVLCYIENCYRTGQINTVIKRYIEEGII